MGDFFGALQFRSRMGFDFVGTAAADGNGTEDAAALGYLQRRLLGIVVDTADFGVRFAGCSRNLCQ